MFLLHIIFAILSSIGLVCVCINLKDKFIFRGFIGVPHILLATLMRHSNYDSDRDMAQKIINSYEDVHEYRKLLLSYSKSNDVDYKEELRQLKTLLKEHESIARVYRSTNAYSEDKRKVKFGLNNIQINISKIEKSTGTKLESLMKAQKESLVDTERDIEALNIHNENVRKCDTVRLYNHKAVPLRELSDNLINMLKNMKDKHGMEESRERVLEQLKELSKVIDTSVEALPTYDSISYVENKINTNQKLLEGLKNTSYVDMLQIEK